MADIESRLKNLPAESRSRVEEALKKTLETELANVAKAPGSDAMAHSRSRGLVFSRSRTTDALRGGEEVTLDKAVLRNLDTLDDASFSKFAERIGTIKNLAKEK